jgi:hypothetical protein
MWLPKWLPEGYPKSPMRLADEVSNLLGLGIAVR